MLIQNSLILVVFKMKSNILILPLLMFFSYSSIRSQETADLSSLLAVQVIFRHGARNIERTFPTDPYADESLWPNGFHQLTCIGKVQAFQLGLFLRGRYDGFLNSTYVRREIQAVSSDVDRTIQSAYAVLAGIYNPEDIRVENSTTHRTDKCEEIDWSDVPVHTISFEIDNVIRQESPCPRYQQLQDEFYASDLMKNRVLECAEELALFQQHANVTEFRDVRDLSKFYDALIVENYYGLPLSDWANTLLKSEKLRELSLFYFQTLSYTEEMKRFRAGPLFDRIVDNFDLTLHGDKGEKHARLMYLLSGHDHTITSFLDTIKLYSKSTRPTFSAAVIIELHAIQNSNELELRLFLRNETDTTNLYPLQIPDCPSPCKYDKFLDIIDPYRISYAKWTTECGLVGQKSKSQAMDYVMWTIFVLALALLGVVLVMHFKGKCSRNNRTGYRQY